jgi:glycerol-3-phosphate acyltransferase PlsY
MGAQNAFRELGAKIGVAVGVVDAGKGAVAILIAQAVSIPIR